MQYSKISRGNSTVRWVLYDVTLVWYFMKTYLRNGSHQVNTESLRYFNSTIQPVNKGIQILWNGSLTYRPGNMFYTLVHSLIMKKYVTILWKHCFWLHLLIKKFKKRQKIFFKTSFYLVKNSLKNYKQMKIKNKFFSVKNKIKFKNKFILIEKMTFPVIYPKINNKVSSYFSNLLHSWYILRNLKTWQYLFNLGVI